MIAVCDQEQLGRCKRTRRAVESLGCILLVLSCVMDGSAPIRLSYRCLLAASVLGGSASPFARCEVTGDIIEIHFSVETSDRIFLLRFRVCIDGCRNHRSAPGGAGVDPQRGGAAKKNLDPYLTPKGGQLTPKT